MAIIHNDTQDVLTLVHVAAEPPADLSTELETDWTQLTVLATDDRCPACEGRGQVHDKHGHARPCPTCKGLGELKGS